MALLLVLLALADAPVSVSEVMVVPDGDGWAVLVRTTGTIAPVDVLREGDDVVLVVGAVLAEPLSPEPGGEIAAVAVEAAPDQTRIRVRPRRPQPYEIRQEPGLVTLAFPRGKGEEAARSALALRDLYAKIRPPGDPSTLPSPSPPPAAEDASSGEGGFHLGLFRLRPSIVINYIDGDYPFLETAAPVGDRYVQIEPHLGVGAGGQIGLPGGAGIQVVYEPRLRASTSFSDLRRPTHLATARIATPVGGMMSVRGMYHYADGLLETTEVDPGREYFFNLAPFTRRQASATASLEPGGRFALDLTASRDSVRVEGPGFFDHRTDRLLSALRYELREELDLQLSYVRDWIPAPVERPLAEARGSVLQVGLEGELGPLLSGGVAVGLRRLEAPQAPEEGRRFQGAVLSARLTKEFTPAASMGVSATRATYPSAFERNAFYVASGAGAEAHLGLPLSMVARAAVGWQRNAYSVPAPGADVARRDDLLGWSAGVGRSLTRWAFVRVDYRRERRRSNIPDFNSETSVVVVGLGLGFVDAPVVGTR
ncbi:MAG TPA: outer membrane beta-barrel protein [Vicinamibacteria bacterium]|nr:outer membrane beta-barrel protein [Vicinamibacteria bacterium]